MCKTLIIKNIDVNINEDLENLVNNPEVLLYTRSSGPRPVKLCSLQAIKFFSFFEELYKNKLKNLIRTSKFKFSFRGLLAPRIICCDTGTKIVIYGDQLATATKM
jgi:hypothetical protein